MTTALPTGLLDAPYDLERLLDYWLSLPSSTRAPWWTAADARRFEREASEILTQFRNGRRPSQVIGDFPDWETPLDGLKAIEADTLPSIGQALVALVNGRVKSAFGEESPLNEPWRRFGHEILEILYWVAPDRFAPSIFGFEFLAYTLRGSAELAWDEIEVASRRLLVTAGKRGLDPSSIHVFSRWLSSWGELTVRESDDAAIRGAKDVLWQVVGPAKVPDETIARGAGVELVIRTCGIGSVVANELSRSRDGALHELAAPSVVIEPVPAVSDANYVLVAAPAWQRVPESLFSDGNSYALMCGPAEPIEVPELVQTGLRRLFSGRRAERVVLDHRPAWQKQDGLNAERKRAWGAAVHTLGLPSDGHSVTWGEFDTGRRVFTTDRNTVRQRVVLETVVRASLERPEHLDVLRAISAKASAPIESFMATMKRGSRSRKGS